MGRESSGTQSGEAHGRDYHDKRTVYSGQQISTSSSLTTASGFGADIWGPAGSEAANVADVIFGGGIELLYSVVDTLSFDATACAVDFTSHVSFTTGPPTTFYHSVYHIAVVLMGDIKYMLTDPDVELQSADREQLVNANKSWSDLLDRYVEGAAGATSKGVSPHAVDPLSPASTLGSFVQSALTLSAAFTEESTRTTDVQQLENAWNKVALEAQGVAMAVQVGGDSRRPFTTMSDEGLRTEIKAAAANLRTDAGTINDCLRAAAPAENGAACLDAKLDSFQDEWARFLDVTNPVQLGADQSSMERPGWGGGEDQAGSRASPTVLTLSGTTGYSFTYKTTVDKAFSQSLEFALNGESTFSLSGDGDVAPIPILIVSGELSAKYGASADTSRSRASSLSTVTDRTTAWTFEDSTIGDSFVVRVSEDSRFGTPFFSVIGGRSKCGCERGTVCREGVKIEVEAARAINVPHGHSAWFNIKLTNDSPTKESWASNPGGQSLEKSADGSETVAGTVSEMDHNWGTFSLYTNMATNPTGIGMFINGKPFNGEWYLDNFPYGMFNVVLELRPGPNTIAPQPIRLELKSGCDATSVHDQAWLQASWQHKCAAVGWSTTLQDAARPRLYASGAAADDFIALTMRNPEFQLRPTVPRAMHGARAYNTAYRGTFLLVRGPATSGAWMKASEGLGKLCVAHEKRTLEWLEPPPAWLDQVKAGELVAPVVAGAAQGALKAYCDCPVGGDASCVRDCGCTSKLDPQCNWLDLGDAINLGQLNGTNALLKGVATGGLAEAGNLARFEDDYGFMRVDWKRPTDDGDYELKVYSQCDGDTKAHVERAMSDVIHVRVDTRAPEVASWTPEDGGGYAGGRISLTFNEEIDCSPAEGVVVHTAILDQYGGAACDGCSTLFFCQGNVITLSIEPSTNAHQANGSKLTASVSGVRDLAGNEMTYEVGTKHSWTFTMLDSTALTGPPPVPVSSNTSASTSMAERLDAGLKEIARQIDNSEANMSAVLGGRITSAEAALVQEIQDVNAICTLRRRALGWPELPGTAGADDEEHAEHEPLKVTHTREECQHVLVANHSILDQLLARLNTFTPDTFQAVFSYQWMRGTATSTEHDDSAHDRQVLSPISAQPIAGATTSTYVITALDVGAYIAVNLSYSFSESDRVHHIISTASASVVAGDVLTCDTSPITGKCSGNGNNTGDHTCASGTHLKSGSATTDQGADAATACCEENQCVCAGGVSTSGSVDAAACPTHGGVKCVSCNPTTAFNHNQTRCEARYHCVGDLNGDLTIDTSDLVDLLEDLSLHSDALVGGHHPSDLCRGDLDRNGRVDVEDLIYFITLFGATIPPSVGCKACPP